MTQNSLLLVNLGFNHTTWRNNTRTLSNKEKRMNWTHRLGYEARRQPEVIDDDSDNGTGPMLELDTWKPTTKDFKKKVASENEVLVWHPNAIADPSLCRDQRPEETQSCNRQPCPGAWVEKLWTKVSAVSNHLHPVV